MMNLSLAQDSGEPSTLLDVAAGDARASGAAPVLLEYWNVIRRWRWVLVGAVLLCIIIGLIVTMLMTPKYTASARLEIARQQQRITNVEGLEDRQAGRDDEFYQTQYALLGARTIAERVARSLNLANDAAFFQAHGIDLASQADTSVPAAAQASAREEQAIALLRGNVQISPIARSALVDVRYTSASPAMSAKIVNSWTAQFIQASIDRRFASTADARKFLENQLSTLRGRLETSEKDLVAYATERGIVPLTRTEREGKTENGRTLAAINLEALNEALAEATAARIQTEARFRTAGDQTNAQVLTSPTISALRQRRAEASAEYSKLLVQFEPEYPAARGVREQIAQLDAAIAGEVSRISSGSQSDYRGAVQREQALKDRVAELTSRLNLEQRESIQYNIYQREVDTNRQLYEGLLQRYKEIGVAGVAANNMSVVDSAKVPRSPSSPNLWLNLAIATMLGFGLAGVIIFALEQIDEGLRNPADVNRLLGLPLLGGVPDFQDERVIDLLRDPKSMISEAYLTICSGLAFSTDHGVPRTLLLTSTRAQEGKSTSSFGMAIVLARTGKRVLLVDADMRSPSIASFVGIDTDSGLSKYLAGDDNWEKMIHKTEWINLSVMGAGPVPPSAAELLSGDRAHLLLAELSQNFDIVVIDGPPVLGLADAPLLARAAEGVVYVVQTNGVPARGVNQALARLRVSGTHIFGGVLTKMNKQDGAYGYGTGYGYGLEYGRKGSA